MIRKFEEGDSKKITNPLTNSFLMIKDSPGFCMEQLQRRKNDYRSYCHTEFSVYKLLKPLFLKPFLRLGFYRVIQATGGYLMIFVFDKLTDELKYCQSTSSNAYYSKYNSIGLFVLMLFTQFFAGLSGKNLIKKNIIL